jgi:hypothetical protein
MAVSKTSLELHGDLLLKNLKMILDFFLNGIKSLSILALAKKVKSAKI